MAVLKVGRRRGCAVHPGAIRRRASSSGTDAARDEASRARGEGGAARRWLGGETPALRYMRDVGYGWYLVHQPVIVAIAFVVVRGRASVGAKILELLVLSVAGTLFGAELLRRLPFAGRILGLAAPGEPAATHAARP